MGQLSALILLHPHPFYPLILTQKAYCLRVTVNSKRAETGIGRKAKPALWNSTAGQFTGTKEEIKAF